MLRKRLGRSGPAVFGVARELIAGHAAMAPAISFRTVSASRQGVAAQASRSLRSLSSKAPAANAVLKDLKDPALLRHGAIVGGEWVDAAGGKPFDVSVQFF